ncbi:MAG TPA: polyphenol oxidase family protein [Ruania sp.]|nr:polyphenol oxidase family protein [Ruania sp.]
MLPEADVLSADLGQHARGLFTTRSGGLSEGEYSSLNLGAGVGDEPEAVARNRGVLARKVDAPVGFMRQVHGTEVHHWDAQSVPTLGEEPVADVLLTDAPGAAVGVLVADCVPVLLAGPGGVAAVHAGRRGLLAGVVESAVTQLAGAGVAVTHAAIGPCICAGCYEVPQPLQTQACSAVPELRATTTWGTPSLDLAAGVRARLQAAGVRQIDQAGVCTREDERFFSYRRQDGICGRTAGVARLS